MKETITTMFSQAFYTHGHLCASHPWEVILAFLTITISMLFMDETVFHNEKVSWNCHTSVLQENKGIEVVTLTITRIMALLYIYNQFRNLYKLGSKYLIGIAGLFTVFSSFVFSSSVVNFLQGNFSELSEALPVFLLLIDFSKAGLLAQFALSSFSQAEVRENIAQGMAILGPTITLDTIVETLVIGVGTLSGVKRLEEMCCFACLSAIVNYIVFMTFFPACLSLVLELSRDRQEGRPTWHLSSLTKVLQQEEEQKPNPVLQRVKVIMSAGLVLVHAHSRWTVDIDNNTGLESHPSLSSSSENKGEIWYYFLHRWFSASPEQMVMVVIAGALAVKYVYFENYELSEHLSSARISSPTRNNQNHKDLSSVYSSKLQQNSFTPVRKVSWPMMSHEYPLDSPNLNSSSTYIHHFLTNRSVSFTLDDSTRNLVSQSKSEKEVQTEEITNLIKSKTSVYQPTPSRNLEECIKLLNLKLLDEKTESSSISDVLKDGYEISHRCNGALGLNFGLADPRSGRPKDNVKMMLFMLPRDEGVKQLTDEEILMLVQNKNISAYKLETVIGDYERGVLIRRKLITKMTNCGDALDELPYLNYNYELVMGACCENVIGYMPVPIGIAGPLILDGKKYNIPLATTEGCLVASTNRGCRAIALSGGAKSNVMGDGMTRGPVVRLPSANHAVDVMKWLQKKENFECIKSKFDSTSRFAKLKNLRVQVAGHYVFIRFVATTGDAMGMNMLSKGTEVALYKLKEVFPDMEILSISGNYCTDKKPAAINWIEGRGKSVVCEAEIPAKVVKEVLKTTVQSMIDVNNSKNLVGSAMAGCIGGFNAQASNIVTALFIATGQDPAQNVGSSNCITLMEPCGPDNQNLHISCTMPSIEIGTIGGGTNLPPQAACLALLGVKGPCKENPGENASLLARIVCATVLAGELSLISALSAGHLVRSHMIHNRSQANIQVSSDHLDKS